MKGQCPDIEASQGGRDAATHRERERERNRARKREREMSSYMLHFLHLCCMHVHFCRPWAYYACIKKVGSCRPLVYVCVNTTAHALVVKVTTNFNVVAEQGSSSKQ